MVMMSHFVTRRPSRLYLLLLLLQLFSFTITYVDSFVVLKSRFNVLSESQRIKLHSSSRLFADNSKTSKEDQSNIESSTLWSNINSIPSNMYFKVKNNILSILRNKKNQDSKKISYANDPQHIVFVNINELYPIAEASVSSISCNELYPIAAASVSSILSFNQTNILCPVTEERRIFTHDLITRLKLGQLNRAEKESYYYSALNFGNSVDSRKPVVISDKSCLNNYSSHRINIETTNQNASVSYSNHTKINSPGKLCNSNITAFEDTIIMQSDDESTRNNQCNTIIKFTEETDLVKAYVFDSESNPANDVGVSGNDLYNELKPENKIERHISFAFEKRVENDTISVENIESPWYQHDEKEVTLLTLQSKIETMAKKAIELDKRVISVKKNFEKQPSHNIRPMSVVLEHNFTKLPRTLQRSKEVIKKRTRKKLWEYDDMNRTVFRRFDSKQVHQIQPVRSVNKANVTMYPSDSQSNKDIFVSRDINTSSQPQLQRSGKFTIGEKDTEQSKQWKYVEVIEQTVVPNFEQKQHLQHLHTINKGNLTATKLSQDKIQQLKDTVGKRNMELAKRLEHAAYMEQKAKCQAKSNQKEVDEISYLTLKSKLMDKVLESHFQKYNNSLSSDMIRKRNIVSSHVIDENNNTSSTLVSKTDDGLKMIQWIEDQEQYWKRVMMKSPPLLLIDDAYHNDDDDNKMQSSSSTFSSFDKKLP